MRAVAVLAVIAYHVGGRPRGGYLGVDVFFVLSGYLITTLLLREHASKARIRLANFWGRRVRRLLPALLLVIGACVIAAAFRTPLSELEARRGDIISTLFYFANWHFIATDTSYFGAFAGTSPLRHMWSLSIEEQFYLVWPLAIAGLLYLRRGGYGLILALTGLGIVVSTMLMASEYDIANPSKAYFGTGARAHELLVGAALAFLLVRWPQLLTSPRSQRLATWIWLPIAAALAIPVVAMGDQNSIYYRGVSLAFAVCVAVALWIIETVPRSLPGTLLSLRPMRWIGMISYGLYLWHWPILVWFGDSESQNAPALQLVLIAATFCAAAISFYVVERPVRAFAWGRLPHWRIALTLGLVFLVAAGGAVRATQIDASDGVVAQVTDFSDKPCPSGSPVVGMYSYCELNVPSSVDEPVVAAIGDSTSRALTPGFEDLAAGRGWGFVQAGQGGCSILPLAMVGDASDATSVAQGRDCADAVVDLVNGVATDFSPDLWIISDRFLTKGLVLPDGTALSPGDPRYEHLVVGKWQEVFQQLSASGAAVAVLAVPPLGEPAECATRRMKKCDDPAFTTADPITHETNRLIHRAVAASAGRAALVSIDDILCPHGQCVAALNGTLVRYDGIHFTSTYSREIVPEILQRIRRAGIRIGPQ